MSSKQEALLDAYKKHFKHLRVLSGLHDLAGKLVVEAETADGRYLSTTVSSSDSHINELEQQLKNWSPGVSNG